MIDSGELGGGIGEVSGFSLSPDCRLLTAFVQLISK